MLMTAINRVAGFCGYTLVPAADAATLAALRRGEYPLLTIHEARRIQDKDFIPKGERVEWRELPELRRLTEYEVLFCCCCTTTDWPQSGPIYCGRIARWFAIMPDGGLVAICEKHSARPRGHLRAMA